jgi:thiol-disulfide isomerase/thioredoxin
MNLYSQHDGDLIGSHEAGILEDKEKYPWFEKAYNAYLPDTAVLSGLSKLINQEVKITVVAGTWCGDTRRELPKFIKIAKLSRFDEKKLDLIFVDTNKSSPGRPEKKLRVKSIPTFIVYKNGMEKGRIVERPTTTLEKDLLNILSQ